MAFEKYTPYDFGNSPRSFEVQRTRFDSRENDLITDTLWVPRTEGLDVSRYLQALEDINRSWRVITDPDTGKQFEIAEANLEAPLDNGVDVELSTFSSSISNNPGNAVEFAENSALHPDRRRVYIASLGNGGSVYWSRAERKHLRQTGRFTDKGKPLPTLASLAAALEDAGLPPTRFSANSMGTAVATGLMVALPEGQVSHAYLKSRPNISNHRLPVVWGLSVLVGDLLDDRKYKKISEDPWKLTGEMIESAKHKMPDIYSDTAENRYRTKRQQAASSHRLAKLYSDMVALSRGGEARGFPASLDTSSAMRHQPEAALTFHFPLQDRLYTSERDFAHFLYQTYLAGSTAVRDSIAAGNLEYWTMSGKHRDHTQYPGMRWAMENAAFSKRAA